MALGESSPAYPTRVVLDPMSQTTELTSSPPNIGPFALKRKPRVCVQCSRGEAPRAKKQAAKQSSLGSLDVRLSGLSEFSPHAGHPLFQAMSSATNERAAADAGGLPPSPEPAPALKISEQINLAMSEKRGN